MRAFATVRLIARHARYATSLVTAVAFALTLN
jgi:hypothetical protein